MISKDKESINIYTEYLSTLNSISLIVSLFNESISLKDFKFNETNIVLKFLKSGDEKEKKFQINFIDFTIDTIKSIVTSTNKPNGSSFESTFKLMVRNRMFDEGFQSMNESMNFKRTDSLFKLCCNNCSSDLLKKNQEKFLVLSLPDNELNELADNFFCHLHDHSHGSHDLNHSNHDAEDLTNELNPLRFKKLRKSVLENQTIFILNENHLDLAKLDINKDTLEFKCSNCNYNIGYKEKNNDLDYFFWKYNVLSNEECKKSNLIDCLDVGRYLLETRTNLKSIYLFILSTNTKILVSDLTQKLENYNIVCLNLDKMEKHSKKLMFKINETIDFKSLKNDINLNNFYISNEHYEFLLKTFKNSRKNNNIKEQDGFEIVLL